MTEDDLVGQHAGHFVTDLHDAIGQPLRVGQAVLYDSEPGFWVGVVVDFSIGLVRVDFFDGKGPCQEHPAHCVVIGSSVAEVDARVAGMAPCSFTAKVDYPQHDSGFPDYAPNADIPYHERRVPRRVSR